MNIDPKDQVRRHWYDDHAEERLSLITDIAERCYKEWDTWDIGPGPYGVQLAYLFATIAGGAGGWKFSLETSLNTLPDDSIEIPFAIAFRCLFLPSHDVWLFIEQRESPEALSDPVSYCPFCAGIELSEIDAEVSTVDGVSGVTLSEWQCRGDCEGRSFWV